MKKVYFFAPNENWIVDRFASEWNVDNADISVSNPHDADVIWLSADWCWRQLPQNLLQHKKVITTIHHIVPEKFGKVESYDFQQRDVVTDVYHVYNERTLELVKTLTDKPIHFIRYWANQNAFPLSNLSKEKLRDKHGLPLDAFIIGSFQRDTENASIASGNFTAKLEKGPDRFCKAVEHFHANRPDVHCLLTAWRRQFVIKRLLDAKVPYSYFELPKQSDLCELYQCLDLYIMSSRVEGGPAALIECGLLNVPVISTPCGIAEQVLPSSAINDDVTKATPAVPNVSNMRVPNAYKAYRDLIENM